MSYQSTIDYLYGLQQYGMKFGLDNIRRLLTVLGNPQKSFRSLHVAGTNGKGSTSAMIESILRTAGVKTGLFTSPHLLSFTERIRINGQEISELDVVRLAQEVRECAEGIDDFSPTFFEVVTAISFLYFREMKIEWAVIETGMGGRLDATNIIMPEASVITSIGMDHREFLGNSLREITTEKTGIIKNGIDVITAAQDAEAMDVIVRRTKETGSALYRYGNEFGSEIVSDDPDNICFNYHGSNDFMNLELSLSGMHQVLNASLAIKAIETVIQKYPELRCNIPHGLKLTQWPGRLEMVKSDPPILIDGAHNPHAAQVLSQYLKKALHHYKRIILVIGIMGDKDRDGILTPLLPLASEIICTAPAYGRAASPADLAFSASALGVAAKTALSVPDALSMAERLYMSGDLIVITGSFYTIGEVKETLGNKGSLARLRE